ncbi:MAG: hypothetical protein K0S78_1554, partial [Thermomicrobiales bacterium]|nr:hypothetical protein [Thermomicrobiales bacterium]
ARLAVTTARGALSGARIANGVVVATFPGAARLPSRPAADALAVVARGAPAADVVVAAWLPSGATRRAAFGPTRPADDTDEILAALLVSFAWVPFAPARSASFLGASGPIAALLLTATFAAAAGFAIVSAPARIALALFAIGLGFLTQHRGDQADEDCSQRAPPRGGETKPAHERVKLPWVHADPSCGLRHDEPRHPSGHGAAGARLSGVSPSLGLGFGPRLRNSRSGHEQRSPHFSGDRWTVAG